MCISPYKLTKNGKYQQRTYRGDRGEYYEIDTYVKCGHCPQCLAHKANNWVVRNYYESQSHEKVCFLTLTYKINPFMLIRKHLQDFIKRLRRYLEYHKKKEIRIFYAGEYGENFGRPHYHIIVYGWEEEKPVYLGLSKKGYPIYQSKLIQDLWGKGRTTYQKFVDKEIAYIALYETANDTAKNIYRLQVEKAKKLMKDIKDGKMQMYYFKDIYTELKKEYRKAESLKKKYIEIREFNGWSKSLGWDNFYKEFLKNPKGYVFKEYIKEAELPTPTSWVKKLANMGYNSAIAEMFRRAAELNSGLEEMQSVNKLRELKKAIFEIEKWYETKDEKDL